jgi:hypothetical protein
MPLCTQESNLISAITSAETKELPTLPLHVTLAPKTKSDMLQYELLQGRAWVTCCVLIAGSLGKLAWETHSCFNRRKPFPPPPAQGGAGTEFE